MGQIGKSLFDLRILCVKKWPCSNWGMSNKIFRLFVKLSDHSPAWRMSDVTLVAEIGSKVNSLELCECWPFDDCFGPFAPYLYSVHVITPLWNTGHVANYTFLESFIMINMAGILFLIFKLDWTKLIFQPRVGRPFSNSKCFIKTLTIDFVFKWKWTKGETLLKFKKEINSFRIQLQVKLLIFCQTVTCVQLTPLIHGPGWGR